MDVFQRVPFKAVINTMADCIFAKLILGAEYIQEKSTVQTVFSVGAERKSQYLFIEF
jgi:hypothetical protein